MYVEPTSKRFQKNPIDACKRLFMCEQSSDCDWALDASRKLAATHLIKKKINFQLKCYECSIEMFVVVSYFCSCLLLLLLWTERSAVGWRASAIITYDHAMKCHRLSQIFVYISFILDTKIKRRFFLFDWFVVKARVSCHVLQSGDARSYIHL